MPEEALHIIEEGSGSQFDPMLVQAFLDRFDDIRQAWQRFWEKDHGNTKTTDLIGAAANPDAALYTVDHLEYSTTEG